MIGLVDIFGEGPALSSRRRPRKARKPAFAWGPSLPYFIDKIQRTIDSWEGTGVYSLDVIDLSGFEKLNK